jgi:hypothetical protein
MHSLTHAVLARIIITIMVMIISLECWSQEGSVIYSVAKTRVIDHSQYDEIKGSPYLYNDWLEAEVLGTEGKIYHFPLVNFNGFTHELELKKDDRVEELIGSSYLKVTLNTGTNKETFLRGLHPEFEQNLVCILYDGQKVKLIKTFDVRVEESVVQTPGAPSVFEKFSRSKNYYLLKDSDLSKVRIKKKSVIAVLGHKSELEQYLKQKKINLNSESALITLLNYYESLLK